MTAIRTTFGERVRHFRERQGWDQKDLPERLSVAGYTSPRPGKPLSISQVSLVERGRSSITVDMLLAYAEVLEVSPIALLLPESEDDQVTLPSGRIIAGDMFAAWFHGYSALPHEGVDDETWDRIAHSVPRWAPWRELMTRTEEEARRLKADLAECWGQVALARRED